MHHLSKIKAFVLIAKKGSISGAARDLNISTATASTHLDTLEGHLGGKLFIRSTRQLVLTDLGRLYLDHVVPIIGKFEFADQLASDFNAKPNGELRLTVGGPIGRLRIASLVERFVAQHPNLDVFLDVCDSFRPVIDEKFHVAIRTGFDDRSSLIQRKIASNHRVLVASPNYLADAPPLKSPEDLNKHALLLKTQRKDKKGTMRFSIGGETRQIECQGRMTSNSNEALKIWAIEHCGIAQKSLWTVADAVAERKLVRLLPDFEPEPADFYAVSPFRSGESTKVDTFVSFLRNDLLETPLC